MSTPESMELRLTELEVKLDFIDEAVQALATADTDQALRMAVLERTLRELRGQLSSLRDSQGDDPHNEPPPPHY